MIYAIFAFTLIVFVAAIYFAVRIRISRNDEKKQLKTWEDLDGDDLYKY